MTQEETTKRGRPRTLDDDARPVTVKISKAYLRRLNLWRIQNDVPTVSAAVRELIRRNC